MILKIVIGPTNLIVETAIRETFFSSGLSEDLYTYINIFLLGYNIGKIFKGAAAGLVKSQN